MAYLVVSDYLPQIKDDNLTAMIGGDNTILETAQTRAEQRVKNFLFARYDTDTIFSQTGTNRHSTLVDYCVNITLYYLHQRLPKRMMPEIVKNNYDDTIAELTKICDAEMELDLPRKLKDDGKPKTQFRTGSTDRQSYTGNYF